MSEILKRGFNWAAEFEKCENERDLLKTGKAAAEHIKALELELGVVAQFAQKLLSVALDP